MIAGMGDDRLTLSLGGDLAEAVRAAARDAGVSAPQWVGAVLAERLAPGPPGAPPDAAPPSTAPEASPAPRPGDPSGLADPAAWELVSEPTATFTVELPRGWDNRAWVVPTPTMKYPMVATTSPDGLTSLFSGDAELPMFLDPAAGMFPAPGTMLRPPTEARQFLAEWAQYRGGQRAEFRLLGVAEAPEVVETVLAGAARTGSQYTWVTAARAEAEYDQDGARVRAVYLGVTIGVGAMWLAQVHGVTSADDPAGFVPALLRLVASVQSTPGERQRLQAERMANDAQHQATMQMINQNTAMMTAGHQQRMADIQASGIAHQQNMASRQAAFDAGVDSWRQQQAGADAQHSAYMGGLRSGSAVPGSGGDPQQDFVNMINEERTVLDAQGDAHQVAAGADRYYHNEHSNTWVGLSDHQDIVEVTGANRDDYQEGTIQS